METAGSPRGSRAGIAACWIGSTRRPLIHIAAFAASAALLAFIAVCYLARPDWAAAVTVFPPWVWVVPGLAMTLVALRLHRGRLGIGLVGAWALFFLMTIDTPAALLRGAGGPRASEDRTAETCRVVTLNCASSGAAVEELAALSPDIVLLQESPSSAVLDEACQALFHGEGEALWGPDCSILARGRVTPVMSDASRRSNCAQAIVRLPTGRELAVVSVRLHPVPLRFDLWSPSAWRGYTANRRRQRDELARIMQGVPDSPNAMPRIVGGDFNAPVGDAIFALLSPGLTDSFRAAGAGWGNTILADLPVHRIDQIWISDQVQPQRVWAQRNNQSDHRMVVGDFRLE